MSNFNYLKIYQKGSICLKISIGHIALLLFIICGYIYIVNKELNNNLIIFKGIYLSLMIGIGIIYIGTLLYAFYILLKTNESNIISNLPNTLKPIGYNQIINKNLNTNISPNALKQLSKNSIGKIVYDDVMYIWHDWMYCSQIIVKTESLTKDAPYQNRSKILVPILPQSKNQDEQLGKEKKQLEDLFAFKTFESGDDPRRIVWKIYGKNRTLHVRKPDDTYYDDELLNIYIRLPEHTPEIPEHLYKILCSQYKRYVLDILEHWKKDAMLKIFFNEVVYSYNETFKMAFLQSQGSTIPNDTMNGIIIDSNIDQNYSLGNKKCLLLNFELLSSYSTKNPIIYRKPQYQIAEEKNIELTNKILNNYTSKKRNNCGNEFDIKIYL